MQEQLHKGLLKWYGVLCTSSAYWTFSSVLHDLYYSIFTDL